MYFLTLRKMRNSMFTRGSAQAEPENVNDDDEAERPAEDEAAEDREDREDRQSAAIVSLCAARRSRHRLPPRDTAGVGAGS